ncbi:MAG: hypothetical protein KGJ86_01420 [Chloroflexota bacterium]|nr:hypothetical protein [Chloroflexota bacterium]
MIQLLPFPTEMGVAAIQVGLVSAIFFLLCATLSWWLYHRELLLSRDRLQAELRAQQLMQRLLTAGERRQLEKLGFIEMPSRLVRGRSYRIPRRRGQVQVYEDGRHAGSLCIQPARWVPDGDVVLMHKLMLEGNEAEYLRTANFFKPYRAA